MAQWFILKIIIFIWNSSLVGLFYLVALVKQEKKKQIEKSSS